MMTEVTIKQLASVLGMTADKLLTQLAGAGMEFSSPDQVVSNTEKVKLLGFLRRTHGKGESSTDADANAPSQITLKRRKVSELKVAGGARGTPAKTVNVEVRAKRTYA
ncbi:MAG: translation initiation factor IF-2 associated domain-containing protein, partial [Xanthomonadales bacterium]|nr:translation initiation factor IF-2 associated domain-containing protein [Xanthomonadales bacterium]